MSVISALFIHKIAQAAALEGLNRSELLLQCRVDPSTPVDLDQMVPSDLHYRLWETIVHKCGPGFPVRYGKTLLADDYGLLGLAIKTAPDMQGAFNRVQAHVAKAARGARTDISEVCRQHPTGHGQSTAAKHHATASRYCVCTRLL